MVSALFLCVNAHVSRTFVLFLCWLKQNKKKILYILHLFIFIGIHSSWLIPKLLHDFLCEGLFLLETYPGEDDVNL